MQTYNIPNIFFRITGAAVIISRMKKESCYHENGFPVKVVAIGATIADVGQIWLGYKVFMIHKIEKHA
jgi:hypothetical protein